MKKLLLLIFLILPACAHLSDTAGPPSSPPGWPLTTDLWTEAENTAAAYLDQTAADAIYEPVISSPATYVQTAGALMDGDDIISEAKIDFGLGAGQVGLYDFPADAAYGLTINTNGTASTLSGNDGYILKFKGAAAAPEASNTLALSSIDLGSGVFELPNSANPTTDAEGEIAFDTDDDMLEIFDGSVSRVLPLLQCKTLTIMQPDLVQAESDDVILFHVMADAFPHGITIKDVALSSSAAMSDTHVIEEWSDRAGTSQSTIESIVMDADVYQEDDGTLSDATIAADAFININLDDATDDVSSLEITFTFYVNQGD